MPKAHSIDLRQRILSCYDQGGVTQEQVAERFSVSLGSVKKLLRQRREVGDIAPQYQNCGGKVKITPEHRAELQRLLSEQGDLTLEEMRRHLQLDCSVQAIHLVLKKMGYSFKKKRYEPVSKTEKISP